MKNKNTSVQKTAALDKTQLMVASTPHIASRKVIFEDIVPEEAELSPVVDRVLKLRSEENKDVPKTKEHGNKPLKTAQKALEMVIDDDDEEEKDEDSWIKTLSKKKQTLKQKEVTKKTKKEQTTTEEATSRKRVLSPKESEFLDFNDDGPEGATSPKVSKKADGEAHPQKKDDKEHRKSKPQEEVKSVSPKKPSQDSDDCFEKDDFEIDAMRKKATLPKMSKKPDGEAKSRPQKKNDKEHPKSKLVSQEEVKSVSPKKPSQDSDDCFEKDDFDIDAMRKKATLPKMSKKPVGEPKSRPQKKNDKEHPKSKPVPQEEDKSDSPKKPCQDTDDGFDIDAYDDSDAIMRKKATLPKMSKKPDGEAKSRPQKKNDKEHPKSKPVSQEEDKSDSPKKPPSDSDYFETDSSDDIDAIMRKKAPKSKKAKKKLTAKLPLKSKKVNFDQPGCSRDYNYPPVSDSDDDVQPKASKKPTKKKIAKKQATKTTDKESKKEKSPQKSIPNNTNSTNNLSDSGLFIKTKTVKSPVKVSVIGSEIENNDLVNKSPAKSTLSKVQNMKASNKTKIKVLPKNKSTKHQLSDSDDEDIVQNNPHKIHKKIDSDSELSEGAWEPPIPEIPEIKNKKSPVAVNAKTKKTTVTKSKSKTDNTNKSRKNNISLKKPKTVSTPVENGGSSRPQRMRIKPLEYWKGERECVFERDGEIIVEIEKPVEHLMEKKRKMNGHIKREPNSINTILKKLAIPSEPENTEDIIPDSQLPTSIHMNLALRPGDALVDYEVVSEMKNLQGMSKFENTPNQDDGFRFCTTLQNSILNCGYIRINEGVKKGRQTSSCVMVFTLLTNSKLEVKINDEDKLTIGCGQHFWVPPGFVYDVKNLSSAPALLQFTSVQHEEVAKLVND